MSRAKNGAMQGRLHFRDAKAPLAYLPCSAPGHNTRSLRVYAGTGRSAATSKLHYKLSRSGVTANLDRCASHWKQHELSIFARMKVVCRVCWCKTMSTFCSLGIFVNVLIFISLVLAAVFCLDGRSFGNGLDWTGFVRQQHGSCHALLLRSFAWGVHLSSYKRARVF